MPAASRIAAQFRLDETTALRTPCRCRWRTTATVPGMTSTPSLASTSWNKACLRFPRPQTVSRPGGSPGAPSGTVMSREARKARTPS